MVLRLKHLVAVSIFTVLHLSPAHAGFARKKIVLVHEKNRKTISVEVAKTTKEVMQGLMHRRSLPKDEGMLFVFDSERPREFWMKNTLINLDIAYIDKERKIVDIQQMSAQKSVMETQIPTYPSKFPAQYALEMNQGWFKKNKFPEGTKFEFVSGPLSK